VVEAQQENVHSADMVRIQSVYVLSSQTK
jgi:hypothetical protein